MWANLESEMDAFKQTCFSDSYRQFRNSLPTTTAAEKRRKWMFLEIENSFLYLIAYVIGSYENDTPGWGKNTEFPQLLTSHMLRLLTDMKVSLTDLWNSTSTDGGGSSPLKGNLYRSSEMLIDKFESNAVEEEDRFALWGTDFWDDCYIALSLFKVKDKLAAVDRRRADAFVVNWQRSFAWLQEQVKDRFRKVSEFATWYGPGFHAAAIELFDYLQEVEIIEKDSKLIASVIKNVTPMIRRRKGEPKLEWERRFAWHAGQLIVAWKKKRESYAQLRALDADMFKLYEELKTLQDEDGAWRFESDVTDTNYNTVRGLAACYVMEKERELANSPHIQKAHDYLLAQAREAKPFKGVVKASVNAIEAYQYLFGFNIPNIHFHLLVSLSYRLHCLGLEKTILSPPKVNEHKLLENVRRVAKERLENGGCQALEPMGINGRLYDYVTTKTGLLDEFNEKDHTKTNKKLQRFLSSTMTEVRSIHAKSLIKDLWTREGLINFLPLIDHLSDLESELAFYAFYRDHLNHEVLLFLLGAYLYYEHQTLRQNINAEIESTYEHFSAAPPKDLEKEFLFRWKLIATFHDIGYLFEIDPDQKGYPTKKDWREEKKWLLEESFGMIDTVRRKFLPEYFNQFNRGQANFASDIAAIETGLKKYLPRISKAEDLFTLKTAEKGLDAFDMIDEMLNTPGVALGIKPGLIKDYFNLCRTKPSARRDKFYDHGVMSALILLKVADIHRFYLRQLSDNRFSKKLKRYHTSFQRRLMEDANDKEAQERFHIRFSHVAGAIALHNIYPKLHTKKECSAFDAVKTRKKEDRLLHRSFYPGNPKSKDRYAISPDENPLAYLTALADVLQDWDRHSFRRTLYEQDDKTPIAAAEVMIKCERNKIIVTPLSASAKARYHNHLKGIKDYLLKTNSYVQLAGINRFLED